MDLEKEKLLRATILTIPGIGSQRLRQLIALYGSAQNAWEAEADADVGCKNTSWLREFVHKRATSDPAAVEQSLKRQGILLVMLGEQHYPCLLAECSDAPPVLFYQGHLKPGQEGLAIVGSRRATPYGKAAAVHFAKAVTEENYVVVSGLARGIDAAAHQGALEAEGVTWAFLAGGLDNIYPPENIGLARRILQKGALISEYPPGVPSEPGLFPARNRLISGASRGVIVVEAAQRSGSLITVDFALEQGREVFAVPGPIFNLQSKGTHQLIKMGAKLVNDKEDIFSELVSSSFRGKHLEKEAAEEQKFRNQLKKLKEVTKNPVDDNDSPRPSWNQWKPILELLSDSPLHIDRLTVLCALPPQEIALGLLELQLAGKIIQLPGQNYVLNRHNI